MPRAERRITGPTPWTPEFRRQAICHGLNDGRFHPARGASLNRLRQMCQSCPNQPDCKEYAIRHEVPGFWGGTTPKQRIEIRRQRGISVYQPKEVIRDLLMAVHRPPPEFGPTQFEIDQACGSHQTRLDDLVHPADRKWEQANDQDRQNGRQPPV